IVVSRLYMNSPKMKTPATTCLYSMRSKYRVRDTPNCHTHGRGQGAASELLRAAGAAGAGAVAGAGNGEARAIGGHGGGLDEWLVIAVNHRYRLGAGAGDGHRLAVFDGGGTAEGDTAEA